MPNGFGRGFGLGRGMGFGFGRGMGFGFGRGMGFGFRGSSPPWPYIGRGRGGLPRCGYFFAGAEAPSAWAYPQAPYPQYGAQQAPSYAPFATSMSKEEELSYLKAQAEAINDELEQIEARARELESEK